MTHRRMPEEEWHRSEDHGALVLEAFAQYRVSDWEDASRKFRLLACACCRRLLPCLHGSAVARLVGTAERYAEGLACREELSEARGRIASLVAEREAGVNDVRNRMPEDLDDDGMVPFQSDSQWDIIMTLRDEVEAGKAILAATEEPDDRDAPLVEIKQPYLVAKAALYAVAQLMDAAHLHELWEPYPLVLPCELVRDAFAFPWREPFLDAWRTPTVVGLARAAYDERQLPSGELELDRLAVLSDALEEAGCDDAYILDHLRSPRPHFLGCWAIDQILDLT